MYMTMLSGRWWCCPSLQSRQPQPMRMTIHWQQSPRYQRWPAKKKKELKPMFAEQWCTASFSHKCVTCRQWFTLSDIIILYETSVTSWHIRSSEVQHPAVHAATSIQEYGWYEWKAFHSWWKEGLLSFNALSSLMSYAGCCIDWNGVRTWTYKQLASTHLNLLYNNHEWSCLLSQCQNTPVMASATALEIASDCSVVPVPTWIDVVCVAEIALLIFESRAAACIQGSHSVASLWNNLKSYYVARLLVEQLQGACSDSLMKMLTWPNEVRQVRLRDREDCLQSDDHEVREIFSR